MKIFLDFEASSLSKASYPIEFGYVREDGKGEAMLIRPAPGWEEWDEAAAAVHRITQEELAAHGVDHVTVCTRVIELAAGNILYASAPSWDGHWLSMLLRAAGYPRHLLRLRDTEAAFVEAARELAAEDGVAEVIAAARAKVEAEPPSHRALEDARREWRIWQAIKAG
jgi:hypothetical protein